MKTHMIPPRSLPLVLISLAMSVVATSAHAEGSITPLRAEGQHFIDADGRPVRFWGVNLVAPYLSHEQAEAMAANLASLQVNIARPHHLMRPSGDWVTRTPAIALSQYDGDSRAPDPEAWDRFDFFNAELRKHGIYLMLPMQASRRFQPGDVDVLSTDNADRAAWMAAVRELNEQSWQTAIDLRKMLPLVDERAMALDEEQTRYFLTHTNPYTGLAYAKDPQVLTLELINETSIEYAVICNNRLPDYFDQKLQAKWKAYAASHGQAEAGDLYKPVNFQAKQLRSAFLSNLEDAYITHMRGVIDELGSTAAVTYSNLWRGETMLHTESRRGDYIEDHMYDDPLVTRRKDDFFLKMLHTQLADQPWIIGELNGSQSADAIKREAPVRTMMPLATAAYGSLQDWSGVVWFSWFHGDRNIGDDGWALSEGRDPHLGDMIADGMMIDHMRTTALIFRRFMVAPSSEPVLVHVDEPYWAGDYHGLMRGKYVLKPGWQNIHGFRKTFRPAADSQKDAPWFNTEPGDVLVSDTGQIIKDINRQQLTVAASQAEAFSGYLDGQTPAGLTHLNLTGEGFATAIVVAADGRGLADSRRLIISRTNIDPSGQESIGPAIRLTGLARPQGDVSWRFRVTRPRGTATAQSLPIGDDGVLALPDGEWHECELEQQTSEAQ